MQGISPQAHSPGVGIYSSSGLIIPWTKVVIALAAAHIVHDAEIHEIFLGGSFIYWMYIQT